VLQSSMLVTHGFTLRKRPSSAKGSESRNTIERKKTGALRGQGGGTFVTRLRPKIRQQQLAGELVFFCDLGRPGLRLIRYRAGYKWPKFVTICNPICNLVRVLTCKKR